MELLAYRSLYLTISANHNLIKSIAPLAKIALITYPDRIHKQKKPKCLICNRTYEYVFMLIMHLEILHPNYVQKYEIKGDILNIVVKQKKGMDANNGLTNNYFVGLVRRSNKNIGSFGGQFTANFAFMDNSPVHLQRKLQGRCKQILNNIIQKFEKTTAKKQQIYFHSTNIFKQINPGQMEQDSEDQIGEVQRELQKLRIEDFSDVNDNDKKFFIQWNGFIHDKRKQLSIILAHDMPKLFIQFSAIAQKKGIPRINLVMHAWTLWSVGQINSNDVVKGLSQYDESAQGIVNIAEGEQNNRISKQNNSLATINVGNNL